MNLFTILLSGICLLNFTGLFLYGAQVSIAPDWVLILILYLALQGTFISGAITAFGLGYFYDIFSGTPVGLNMLVIVTIFFFQKFVFAKIVVRGYLIPTLAIFITSLIYNLLILILLRIFLKTTIDITYYPKVIFQQAFWTTLCCPILLFIFSKLQGGQSPLKNRPMGVA